MHTGMIPLSEVTSPRMKAAYCSSGLISLQLDPRCALNATTKWSPLSTVTSGGGDPSPGALSAHRPTHLAIRCTSRTTLLSLHYFPPPNNPNPHSSTRQERGGRAGAGARARSGAGDVRASLGTRTPFPPGRGASSSTLTVSAAASPEAFSSEAEDPEETSSLRQNSRVLWSVSEKPEAAEKNSGEDGEEGVVQKTTTVLQVDGQDGEGSESGSEPLVVTEEEYKLTDEGTLSTVKVTRGGTSQRIDTNVARALAEVGIQAESLQQKIRNFSVRKFIKEWGKKKPGLEDLKFNPAMYAPRDGVSNITQWTATELTLQRAQLVRISTDASYLVWAFSFFGAVRILEAVLAVFATRPPNFMKLLEAMNAMDPFTVASLAHAVRKPIVGLLNVEPTDLEQVSSLKVKFLTELHKFYERQWKVIATLGVARLFAIIVTRLPSAQWFTNRLKIVWDISMALPIF